MKDPKTRCWMCLFCGVALLYAGITTFLDPNMLDQPQPNPQLGHVFGVIILIGVPSMFYGAWVSFKKMRKQPNGQKDI